MVKKRFIKSVVGAVKQNGVNPQLPQEYQLNIEISNIFNILFIFLVIPFVVVFRETPLASVITAIPIGAHLLSFILIRYQHYKLGRFIFSITTATTVYFVAALLYSDDGTDGMAAKFLILGTIMMPFIVFRISEWRYIALVLTLDLFYLLTFNITNDLLTIPHIHYVDTPQLRLITILTEFTIFTSLFFYYKNVIQQSYQKLDASNRELKQQNSKLAEINATKNKLFSVVSHDLRGSMHSILGCAELLHQNNKLFNEQELNDFADQFYTSSKNTYQVMENLLDWSKAQMDKVQLQAEEFDLQELVQELCVNYSGMALNKSIQLNNQVDNSIYVYADKNIARSVLQNLLTNAVKFSHRNSKVTVSASVNLHARNKYATVFVTDYGVGMDTQTVEQLFQADSAISTSGTENEKGTGLGLLLCKEFTELNGGKIFVHSKPGIGSIFCFTIPFSKAYCPEEAPVIEQIAEPVMA